MPSQLTLNRTVEGIEEHFGGWYKADGCEWCDESEMQIWNEGLTS